MPQSEPIRIFPLYKENDKDSYNKLREHLKGIIRSGLIEMAQETFISDKTSIKDIDNNFETSHIVVVFVSSSLLDCDNCYKFGEKIEDRIYVKKNLKVIPFKTKQCDLEDSYIAGMKLALEAPLNKIDLDDACTSLARHIKETANRLKGNIIVNNTNHKLSNKNKVLLRGHLEDLNFEAQKPEFISAWEQNNKAGCFLLHGDKNHGQQWLMNMLLSYVKIKHNGVKIDNFPLYLGNMGTDLESILETLKDHLGMDTIDPNNEVLSKLCGKANREIVTLTIRGVGVLTLEQLRDFIRIFWGALIDIIKTSIPTYPIIVFLLDEKGTVQVCEDTFCCPCSGKWTIEQPSLLPKIKKIKPEDLDGWFSRKSLQLSHLGLQINNKQAMIEKVMDKKEEDSPQQVLERICRLLFNCGFRNDIMTQLNPYD